MYDGIIVQLHQERRQIGNSDHLPANVVGAVWESCSDAPSLCATKRQPSLRLIRGGVTPVASTILRPASFRRRQGYGGHAGWHGHLRQGYRWPRPCERRRARGGRALRAEVQVKLRPNPPGVPAMCRRRAAAATTRWIASKTGCGPMGD